MIFIDYHSAKEYAESSYWVEPIDIPLDRVNDRFNEWYKVTDWSESGEVHYSRRCSRRKSGEK